MKKLIILVALSLFGLPLQITGQEINTDAGNRHDNTHYIGMAAGFSTGYGISYRYFPDKIGVQLTTTPYISNDGYSTASLGATMLIELQTINWFRFYLYIGNHYMLNRDYEYEEVWNEEYEYYEYIQGDLTNYHRWIAGIGPGFEFLLGEKFSFNLMFGFRSDWAIQEQYYIKFSGETAFYYRF